MVTAPLHRPPTPPRHGAPIRRQPAFQHNGRTSMGGAQLSTVAWWLHRCTVTAAPITRTQGGRTRLLPLHQGLHPGPRPPHVHGEQHGAKGGEPLAPLATPPLCVCVWGGGGSQQGRRGESWQKRRAHPQREEGEGGRHKRERQQQHNHALAPHHLTTGRPATTKRGGGRTGGKTPA